MIKSITLFFTLFITTISTSAFAHTGMEQSSLMHNALHIATAVGIYMAMMLAGLYLFKRLPKAKAQKIRLTKHSKK